MNHPHNFAKSHEIIYFVRGTYRVDGVSTMKTFFALIVFISAVLVCNRAVAQDNVGIKFFGLSIHPREVVNEHLMPNRLDKGGHFVMNLGTKVMYENFFYADIFSVKVIQALYADCAARLGGFSHIGLRGTIFRKGSHSLHGGIGPTLVYRRSWLELPGYVRGDLFKGDEGDKYQYLFMWYGGEIEYKYKINSRIDFAISLVPGYPDLINLSFGINYRINIYPIPH